MERGHLKGNGAGEEELKGSQWGVTTFNRGGFVYGTSFLNPAPSWPSLSSSYIDGFTSLHWVCASKPSRFEVLLAELTPPFVPTFAVMAGRCVLAVAGVVVVVVVVVIACAL